jgi:4Fe-4S ferredoxin
MTDASNPAGPSCRQPPGLFAPRIDRNRCEGKGDCADVCPTGVFVIDVLPKPERAGLSTLGKVKGFVHGWRQSFTPNVGACEACGLCVATCPENAITLVRA